MSQRTDPEGARRSPALDRRLSTRSDVAIAVRLSGPQGEFDAWLLDLSATGARLVLRHRDFAGDGAPDDATRIGLRVSFHFGEGFRIRLTDPPRNLEATLVRVARAPEAGDDAILLGCRFRRRLSARALRELAGSTGPAPRAAARPEPPVPAGEAPWPTIRELLGEVVDQNASDLHIKAGGPVRLRRDGRLIVVEERSVDDARMEAWIREIMPADAFERFLESGDGDFGYSLEGRARFRINALLAKGRMGLAIRRIPEEVPTIDDLGLSPLCRTAAERARGLVLVTGPTGSGKSTTLAAMVRHVNRTRPCHIVTMEDPIEYIHREDRAHITQREVGRDTADFASALRRALRQDPDVLLVGEMRDLETIRLAVTAAETGHLVFATLHTNSAALSISRIIDVFPPEQQRQIRMQLADSLQMVVSQTMLPRIGGGVVVAQEILVANQPVRALIREGKTAQIANVMQTGSVEGMQTLEDVLNDFVARGWIGYEAALAKAAVPRMIERRGRRSRTASGGS